MDPSVNAIEENRRLRGTMRDLVALSTLPAVWVGLGTEGIVRSLTDVLHATLSLDFIYVRLSVPGADGVVEIVRRNGSSVTDVGVMRASLAPLLNADQTEHPVIIQDPFGNGARI